MLQLHGKETPERVAAVRVAFRPAGDEGAADRAEGRSRADPALRKGRRLAAVRRPRAARGDAAGRARQDRSTGRCWKTSISKFRSCCRAGSMPAMSARRCAITRAPRGRCVVGRRARAGREGPRENPRLHPRRARRPATRADEPRATHDRSAAAQLLPHRARRARPFRHLRRPLRRRDADAADPRSGAGLRRRPRTTRPSSARWTAI